MSRYRRAGEPGEQGFTLIELLITIVVVGILSSIAIVGFGGLTNTATTATCKPTMDAARAAVTSYFARQTPTAYPSGFDVMIAANDLELHGGVKNPTATTLTGGGAPAQWTITLNPATGKLTAAGTSAANCN
jgi:prepilin-type N-terminal cleavage/methylation domain-containing protein